MGGSSSKTDISRSEKVRVFNKSSSPMLVTVAAHNIWTSGNQLSISKGDASVSYSEEIALVRKVDLTGAFFRMEAGTFQDFHVGNPYCFITVYKVDGDSKIALSENHPTCRASTVFLNEWGVTVVPTRSSDYLTSFFEGGEKRDCVEYPKFNKAPTLVVVNHSSQEIRVCVDFDEYQVVNQNCKIEKDGMKLELGRQTKVELGVESTGYSVIASNKFTVFAFPGDGKKKTVFFSLMYKKGDKYVDKCRHHRMYLDEQETLESTETYGTDHLQTFHSYRTSGGIIVRDNGVFVEKKPRDVFDADVAAQRYIGGGMPHFIQCNSAYQ